MSSQRLKKVIISNKLVAGLFTADARPFRTGIVCIEGLPQDAKLERCRFHSDTVEFFFSHDSFPAVKDMEWCEIVDVEYTRVDLAPQPEPDASTLPININDTLAAHKFIETLTPKADGVVSGAFLFWHGWALREAFLAGIGYAQNRSETPSAEPGYTGDVKLSDGWWLRFKNGICLYKTK